MRRKTDPLVIGCAAVALICAIAVTVVSATVLDTSARTARNAASVEQVCDLVLNVHRDRVTRLTTTLDYLQTPGGREPTTLNDYIRRVSLPQLRAEVAKERKSLPPTCIAGKRLPDIPQ